MRHTLGLVRACVQMQSGAVKRGDGTGGPRRSLPERGESLVVSEELRRQADDPTAEPVLGREALGDLIVGMVVQLRL
jgi:hypothetical protein